MSSSSSSMGAIPELGQAANLLHGLDMQLSKLGSPYQPLHTPLRQFPVEVQYSHKPKWESIHLTVHNCAASILERLSPYSVEPLFLDGPTFRILPGLLYDNRQEHHKRLSKIAGVDIVDGHSYMLIELRRIDGRADHEVTVQPTRRFFDRMWHLVPQWRKASARLAPGKRIHDGNMHDAFIEPEKAQRYVDSFYQFGTHFISAVEVGDILFQIVEIKPEFSEQVISNWKQLGGGKAVSGHGALTFNCFMGPSHAERVGPIVSFSDDPQLSKSLRGNTWDDPCCSSGPSLMAVFRNGEKKATQELSIFKSIVPVKVEYTSLARFMEYFRAINFERVLRGALLQRWGDRVHLPVRRMPSMKSSIEHNYLQGNNFSANAGNRVFLYGDRVEDLHWSTITNGDTHALGCHRVLSLRGEHQRSHFKNTTLLAQFLDAEPACHRPSVLRLSKDEFDHGRIACQKMVGALILENETGTKQNAVVDGLRFADGSLEPETGMSQVQIRGNLHMLDSDSFMVLLPCIEGALESALVLLSCSHEDNHRRAGAASFAEWIATQLPENSDISKIQQLRTLALCLSRIEACLPVGQVNHSEYAGFAGHDHFSKISSLAIKADEIIRNHDERVWRNSISPDIQLEAYNNLSALQGEISDRYLALLDEISPIYEDEVQHSVSAHCESAQALLEIVSTVESMLGQEELGSAGKVIFDAMVTGPSNTPLAHFSDKLPNQVEKKSVAIALEFTGRESRLRARTMQHQAIEDFCSRLTCKYDALGEMERALSGLVKKEDLARESSPVSNDALGMAMQDGVEAKIEFGRTIEKLLSTWERFETTRNKLMVAKGAHCRVRMEQWFFFVFGFTKCENTNSKESEKFSISQHQFQLERFRLLAVLSKALKRQEGMLGETVDGTSEKYSGLESGAIGYLIAMQNRVRAKHFDKSHISAATKRDP